MTFEPIDLADLHHLPWTQPAPTGGGDTLPPALPPTPWQPRVVEKACGCGVLTGEQCDCQELAAQHEAHLAQPIIFRFNTRRAA